MFAADSVLGTCSGSHQACKHLKNIKASVVGYLTCIRVVRGVVGLWTHGRV